MFSWKILSIFNQYLHVNVTMLALFALENNTLSVFIYYALLVRPLCYSLVKIPVFWKEAFELLGLVHAWIHAYENDIRHRNKMPDTVLSKGRCNCEVHKFVCYSRIHRGKPSNAPFLATFLAPVACHPENLHHCLSFFEHLCQCNKQTCDSFRQ